MGEDYDDLIDRDNSDEVLWDELEETLVLDSGLGPCGSCREEPAVQELDLCPVCGSVLIPAVAVCSSCENNSSTYCRKCERQTLIRMWETPLAVARAGQQDQGGNMQPYWIDHAPDGSAPGLGRIVFSHVHGDGSKHPTEVRTPTGSWVSIPGQFDPNLLVRCLECGANLQREDQIKYQ
ncbi:MAG: hypothetical protein Q8P13_02620 [bacterium]|nr:hypothetical protein [bacterium]